MMIEQMLARYIGVPTASITRLLKLSQQQVFQDAEYLTWVNSLEGEELEATLGQARAAYEKNMTRFADYLSQNHKLSNTAMSSYTLGNWLVGFLQYPSSLTDLARIHARLPQQAVIDLLPELLGSLEGMGKGSREWQRALALLALPLTAAR